MQLKAVFTDLDGTLLRSDSSVSEENLSVLRKLGDLGILRVVATGRSLFFADRKPVDKLPIDYLIFSTGAGTVDWKSRNLINKKQFVKQDILSLTTNLVDDGLDFMIHHQVPDNHFFCLHRSKQNNPDFDRRCERVQQFGTPLAATSDSWHEHPVFEAASQVLIIEPENEGVATYAKLKEKYSGVQFVRTTSPIDGQSVWIEAFPAGVSKGSAADELIAGLGIAIDETLAIGNDYNDLEMLKWAGKSFVVANAPADLRESFHVVATNDCHGFKEAVEQILQCD